MGIGVMVLGFSGSGKTYSIKSMDPDGVGIFAVEKGRLPFRDAGRFKIVRNADYETIAGSLKDHHLKRYVIDDSQYLLVNELFDKAKETGYAKFTDIALHFRNLIHIVNHMMPDDCIVYFLHHAEADAITGKIKAKTIGKMLDEKLTIEGCFDIVLYASVEAGEHSFLTASDGIIPAKSPEGMFKAKIPNDLNLVDKTIREYYGITENTEKSKD